MWLRAALKVVAAAGLYLPVSAFTVRAPYERVSQYLTMRDGVRIAVDVYLPAGGAATANLPTLFHQTRYFRDIELRWPGSAIFGSPYQPRIERFTRSGYAYVFIDVRGSGASFGTRMRPWSDAEVRDALEVLAWIRGQRWSNGRIGAVGWSYDGTATEYLLAQHPQGLHAIAPQYAPFDGYRDTAYPGGIHLSFLTHFFQSITEAMDRNELGSFLGVPASVFVKGVRPVDGEDGPALLQAAIAEHTTNERLHDSALRAHFRDDPGIDGVLTSDSLSSHRLAAALKTSGVPVLNWSGWYDGALARSAIDRFQQVRTPRSRLILGPWAHTGSKNLSPYAHGDLMHDADGELLRFFDRHLKDRSAEPEAPSVSYFTVGAEQWRSSPTWPPPDVTRLALFLDANRTLATSVKVAGTDVLRLDTHARAGNLTRWDAMIIGDPRKMQIGERTALAQSGAYYETPPLSEAVEITGHPVVTVSRIPTPPTATCFCIWTTWMNGAWRA
jgi:uncharacterized protein